MVLSDGYTEYILDQLSYVENVVSKKMFGGVGLYCDSVFFALIADDVLYFKVDDSNRKDYEERGMGSFKPFGESSYSMQYFEVPADIMEVQNELGIWAEKAIDVARRKRK